MNSFSYSDDEYSELMGYYELTQLESGHWLAKAPDGRESPIHHSKAAIRRWVKADMKRISNE